MSAERSLVRGQGQPEIIINYWWNRKRRKKSILHSFKITYQEKCSWHLISSLLRFVNTQHAHDMGMKSSCGTWNNSIRMLFEQKKARETYPMNILFTYVSALIVWSSPFAGGQSVRSHHEIKNINIMTGTAEDFDRSVKLCEPWI